MTAELDQTVYDDLVFIRAEGATREQVIAHFIRLNELLDEDHSHMSDTEIANTEWWPR